MNSELTSRLTTACELAREAGQWTLRYFQRDDLQVDLKSDASPVTIADREAEQLLRNRIAAAFPHDGVLGEEFGEQPGTSGYRWILDPIDGTKSFIHGVPLYAALIGIELEGESRAGVIHIPPLGEMAYGAMGQGAWFVRGSGEPRQIRVSTKKKLADGLFLTSDPANFTQRSAWPVYERMCAAAKLSRTWGDAYGYLLVATGRAEVMVDPLMNLWDAAALLPILQEAGGTYTDWQGNATIAGGEGIATNGLVLKEALMLMQGKG
ncbi:MAG: histidinol-phosphatase [Pirellulales bacterium]|nr:histidinol-phosphatase [Pirellulales bacterium]